MDEEDTKASKLDQMDGSSKLFIHSLWMHDWIDYCFIAEKNKEEARPE